MNNKNGKRFKFTGIVKKQDSMAIFGIVCMIITYAIIVQLSNSMFLSAANVLNILKQVVTYGLLAMAMAIPLINGNFDMSISATAALSGMMSALITTTGLYGLRTSFFPAVLITLAACALVGLINGLIVTYTRISPFIVTLGTQTAIKGVVYIISDNRAVGGLGKEFVYLGFSDIAGIPVSVVVLFVVFIVMGVVLRKTVFGRKLFANGGNYVAAFYSGIDVRRTRVLAYIVSGVISGIAGVLLASRSGSAQPTAAEGYEATAISICAMGGVAMHGGSGSVLGILLGAIMMGMISNGMNLMQISSNWQYVVRGIILIVAVFYSQIISDKALKK